MYGTAFFMLTLSQNKLDTLKISDKYICIIRHKYLHTKTALMYQETEIVL